MNREILKIDHLTVRFGGLVAVNDVGFSIFKDEIVSLIGPNGAGKTTTFNAITGFVKRASGSIDFEGQELKSSKPHEVAERGIVRTFQITSLFPNLSALANIRTGHHLQERETLLDAIFNTKRRQRMEKITLAKAHEILGFTSLGDKGEVSGGNLPYGEQRLLEIGIALAANPRLLLLDEPSAGLNDTETQRMKELIKKIRDQGITILLVEQNANMALELADYAYVMETGTIVLKGPSSELKKDEKVIKAYLGGLV